MKRDANDTNTNGVVEFARAPHLTGWNENSNCPLLGKTWPNLSHIICDTGSVSPYCQRYVMMCFAEMCLLSFKKPLVYSLQKMRECSFLFALDNIEDPAASHRQGVGLRAAKYQGTFLLSGWAATGAGTRH